MVLKADFKIIENNTLLTKWNNGYISLEEVKEIMEYMLTLIKNNKIIHYIDDISECEVDWEEADKWIVNDWYPRALDLKVTKNALIVKEGVNMQHKDEQCEIKSFSNIEDAMSWLKVIDTNEESVQKDLPIVSKKYSLELKILIILLFVATLGQVLFS